MGTLDTLLKYKQYRDAQATADIDAVPQALQAFQAGRQQRTENLLKELTVRASLAKSGLDYDAGSNQIYQRPDLMQNTQRNLVTIDEDGNVVVAGQVGKRDIVKQLPQSVDKVREKAEARADVALNAKKREAKEVPTADIRNKRYEIQNAYSFLKDMQALAGKSKAGYEGLLALGAGKLSRGEADTDTIQYDKVYRAGGAALYRAVTGDTRLSDQDAADRAYKMLWNPTEGEKLRDSSFETLNMMLNNREATFNQLYGDSTEPTQEYEYREVNGKRQRRLKTNG